MSDAIIDACILIAFFRGDTRAAAFVAALTNPSTHLIVAAELLAGARSKSRH